MTIAIGGPEHGKIVDWPLAKHHWVVAEITTPRIAQEPAPLDKTFVKQHYYIAEKLGLFGFNVWVWRHESTVSPWIDPHAFAKLLLPEILSYKGARMLADSGVAL
jgi:hypothetical protein